MIERNNLRPIIHFGVLYGNISVQYAKFVYYAECFPRNDLICGMIIRQFSASSTEFYLRGAERVRPAICAILAGVMKKRCQLPRCGWSAGCGGAVGVVKSVIGCRERLDRE